MPEYFEEWVEAMRREEKRRQKKKGEDVLGGTFSGFGERYNEAWGQFVTYIEELVTGVNHRDEAVDADEDDDDE